MSILTQIYQNFLISSFGKIEMTKLEKISGYSHDVFTKTLLDDTYNEEKLWKSTKSLLRNYENEEDGCIIIDDTILNKPYTKENDIVCWHYDHTVGRSIKGICMLNFHYTDISGVSIPLAYEIVTKTEEVLEEDNKDKKNQKSKSKKKKRKSKFTKNEIMRDKLEILHNYNQIKYRLTTHISKK